MTGRNIVCGELYLLEAGESALNGDVCTASIDLVGSDCGLSSLGLAGQGLMPPKYSVSLKGPGGNSADKKSAKGSDGDWKLDITNFSCSDVGCGNGSYHAELPVPEAGGCDEYGALSFRFRFKFK